jgi:anthranilate synthase/aminodeoxychorismate synthase-like glutamine amidotransferase
MRRVLMIDNLDSFTFNLVEAFERLDCPVRVVRNSVDPARALAEAEEQDALLVLSPGPGRPEDAGCCMALIEAAIGRTPVLGVCLGHQAIVLQAGGEVARAPEPVHGKASFLRHDGAGPFRGIDALSPVGRYHSLHTRKLPDRFRIHAEADGIVMAISDSRALQWGLQFHPESILTRGGDRMLANILADSRDPRTGTDNGSFQLS